MPARGFLARRSRLSTILLVLLGLFLLGTVAVLSTAKAYFSIDKSAYILPEELGNWEEIRWGTGADSPLRWASKYPWLYKLLHPSATPEAIAEAKLALLAASEGAANIAPPLRDNSAKPADPASPPEKIPRIIHQTWKEDALPPKWQSVRDECAAIHPDYEYKLWTDASSRAFIAEYYPWFLSTFDSYPYNIQRADAIRYFVLHHYGGIYMDLDIGCTRRLDPLLRFEVILPVTRPVGVSNDLIFAAKGHPFTDQLIHNLITFNHVYLSHYPTVMFSTGPMFVSASYGLYVDSHGAASPSTPDQPAMGFQGVRVLPKSLYGKNAKPAEVPDAFFKHYYGSSWHAGDAGFLIFLRDHGRLLMFFGACIVAYGFCKALLPKALFSFRKSQQQRHSSASRNSSRRRTSGLDTTDQWVGLPFQTTTTTTASRATKKRQGISRSFSQTPDTRLDMDSLELSQLSSAAAGPSRTHRPSSRSKSSVTASDVKSAAKPPALSVAAPKPQRATLPFFELQEDEDEDEAARLSPTSSHASSTDEPRGILASWSAAAAATVSGVNGAAGLPHDSRPGSSLGSQSDYGSNGRGSRWRQATTGVLLLPAYALKRMGSPGFGFGRERSSDGDSDELSPSDSLSSLTSEGASSGEQPVWRSRRNSLRSGGASSVVGWAAQMLPSGWRGPVTTDSGGGGGGAHVEERRPLQGGGDLEEDLGDGDVEARRSSAERLAAQSKSRRGRGGSAWLDTAPPDSADAHATTTSSSKRPPTASIPLSRQPSNATSAGGDTPYETVATPTQYLRPVAAAELESRTPPPPYAASTTPTGVSGSGGGTKES